MINRFRFFIRAQEGIAYLEFAITIPFLIALFLGAVEVTRYIIVVQKVEKAAVTLSDVVAQSSTISTSQLNVLSEAVGQVMLPYSFNSNGYIIVTSVYRTGTNQPVVRWQYAGGGTWIQSSQIGSTGTAAVLPEGLTLDDKENIIIAEVFYNYSTMITNSVISGGLIYKIGVFKPRLGELTTLGSS